MQLLTFMLNDIRFGIPVSDVESIETPMRVVGVPEAPAHIRGIMNLHGEVIPVYSLADRFGYGERKIQNIIVARMEGMKIGLEVERVDEILEVQDRYVTPMPTIMNASQHCFNDVVSYHKELIVMFDVSHLIPEAEREKIQKLLKDRAAGPDKG